MFNWIKNLFSSFNCEHRRVRCIHGDEIIHLNWNRGVCLDCGSLLKDLPEYCYYSKEKHSVR